MRRSTAILTALLWAAGASPGAARALGPQQAAASADTAVTQADACVRDVEHAVALARSGRLDDAAAELEGAALRYPTRPEPWRELAGLRFRQHQWSDAEQAAACALARDAGDTASWHLLGASRFMQQRRDAALAAWNTVDAPVIHAVRVDGIEQMKRTTVADAIGLEPDDVLTPESLRLARRRLELLPSVASGRVDFRPDGPASAEVQVSLVERRAWQPGWASAGVFGVRAFTERRVLLSVPAPTGSGDILEASYRWWERRPRAALAVKTSRVPGLRGLVRLEAAAETQTYAARDAHGAAPTATETAREATLSWAQWILPAWRGDVSAGFHHLRERGDFASVGSAIEWRSADDHRSIRAGVSLWPRVDRAEALTVRTDVLVYRCREFTGGIDLTVRAGWSGTDAHAPLALWPGAGTGQGRDGLLRAHPLIASGVIDGAAFAPSLALAGVESTKWIGASAGIVGLAAFVDAARITAPFSGDPFIADAGLGLRLRPPGRRGQVRIDFAAGLTERREAISMAWESLTR